MVMFSLLVVASVVTSSLASPLPDSRDEYPRFKCQDGFKLVEETCFLLADASGTWFEGQKYCNEQGTSLATISSDVQQVAVTKMLSKSVWIGYNDLKNHTYGWADLSDNTYTSFADGEPNNSGDILYFFGKPEDCVEMRDKYDYLWNDEHCKEDRQFLCSTSAELITTTTTTTTTTTPAPVCEDGWKMFELSCYKVSETEATWMDAKTLCANEGADLASITSDAEQNYLSGELKKSTWIGLNDLKESGTYIWDDGCESEYTNWAEDEPNNFYSLGSFGLSEDCVEMRQDYGYQWNDKRCSTTNPYICEKAPQ